MRPGSHSTSRFAVMLPAGGDRHSRPSKENAKSKTVRSTVLRRLLESLHEDRAVRQHDLLRGDVVGVERRPGVEDLLHALAQLLARLLVGERPLRAALRWRRRVPRPAARVACFISAASSRDSARETLALARR